MNKMGTNNDWANKRKSNVETNEQNCGVKTILDEMSKIEE